MASDSFHIPVLLHESVETLKLRSGSVVVDGTVGGGGHAFAILEETGPDGVLIGLDRDGQALATAGTRLESFGERVQLLRRSFRDLENAVAACGYDAVDAVLLDLGVSSHEIDESRLGFRFRDAQGEPEPLDMRMDTRTGPTAAELLQNSSALELERWFREYGELPGARRLAAEITQRRRSTPFRTNADLMAVVREVGVGRGRKHHPATLVFQALRIAVNDELGALEAGLQAIQRVLRPGGRVVIISYHSLEDRLVKRSFRAAAKGCTCPPKLPVCVCGGVPTLRVITRRPVSPSEEECAANPRARSARLRAAERIAEAR